MSEEITEKEEFIKIVGILSFSDVHPVDCKYITHFIIDLAKENQELKERLEHASHNYTKYIQERDNILDEIREYINNTFTISSVKDMYKIMDGIEEILDKVEE